MGQEIERKYLVNKDKWDKSDKGEKLLFRQGYILVDASKTVRIRLTDKAGFITIKGMSIGASRPEYEYTIPKEDAAELLDKFCTSVVSKIRHKVLYQDKLWEVDEFLDENAGLIIAELELSDAAEAFQLPGWIDKEVTDDKRYYNSNLSMNPYKNWRE